MKYSILLLMLSATLGLVKRAKQENPLGNKYWVYSSSTISPALDINMDGKVDTDILKAAPKCEIDDAIRLDPEGVLMTHRGKVHCFEDEEVEEEAGTWTYNPKTKVLVLDFDDSHRASVMTLTEVSSQRITAVSTHESSMGKHTIRTVLTPK